VSAALESARAYAAPVVDESSRCSTARPARPSSDASDLIFSLAMNVVAPGRSRQTQSARPSDAILQKYPDALPAVLTRLSRRNAIERGDFTVER
jgi:hypothetical protein